MLFSRVLTAVPLMVALFWVVLAAPGEIFVWMVVGITALAAREWGVLSGLQFRASQFLYALIVAALVWVLAAGRSDVIRIIAVCCLAGWLAVVPVLIRYPRSASRWLTSRPGKAALGAGLLVGAGSSLVALRGEMAGPEWLMALFVVIWVSDTGAYFVGRRFGRHKLLPAVSPGKTVEGLAGGVALVVAAVIIGLTLAPVTHGHPVFWVWAGIMVTLFGVVGDLLESWLKREAGVKDSGRLLPGHGGVLDRIDSICAAAPVGVALFTLASVSGGHWQ
ncbi:MAG: phosphatidate cytidylyltransferase [Pseudomonadota bacterium]|nr:phosphatidate cytidylyltransferase [Pseudomonadota bacterium]